jgi:hypothetical protein
MKLTQQFNRLTFSEYISAIDRHRDYSNFNTLGLFRSILENDKLDLERKIEIRDLAIATFDRQFEFLQLKDPQTYIELQILGQQDITKADRHQLWQNLIANQQKILTAKKIKRYLAKPAPTDPKIGE